MNKRTGFLLVTLLSAHAITHADEPSEQNVSSDVVEELQNAATSDLVVSKDNQDQKEVAEDKESVESPLSKLFASAIHLDHFIVPEEYKVEKALNTFGNGLRIPEHTDRAMNAHAQKNYFAALKLVEAAATGYPDPVSSLSEEEQENMKAVHGYAQEIAADWLDALWNAHKTAQDDAVRTVIKERAEVIIESLEDASQWGAHKNGFLERVKNNWDVAALGSGITVGVVGVLKLLTRSTAKAAQAAAGSST